MEFNEDTAKAMLQYISVGAKLFAPRLLTLISTLVSAALWGFVLYQQSYVSAVGAAGFSLMVLWPVMQHERKSAEKT